MRREAHADSHFVFAVRTTGVYCRPSCRSRQALRQNVSFFDSPADAERAGFRPCRRCRPGETSSPQTVLIEKLCRLIDGTPEPPTLHMLAREAGVSPFHLQRLFKKVLGVTPKEYSAARRAERLRQELPARADVTDAMYRAGYNSSGRFYANAPAELGMTPSAYGSGGAGVTIHFAIGTCSLGNVLVAATCKGICCILLGDDSATLERDLRRRFFRASIRPADKAFNACIRKVVALVETPALGLNLPLDIRGTAFQQRVWKALRGIACGKRVSYTELAAKVGAPKAVRAVASACAANVIAVAIPCHRVVRSDGSLSGYRWGVERKRELLKRERFN